MAQESRTPGVYVDEVPGGARLITGVATSVAAFIGKTGKPANAPVLVRSYKQYTETFGAPSGSDYGYLADAVYGFFANGGASCYVVGVDNISADDIRGSATSRTGLAGLATEPTVTMVAAPDLAHTNYASERKSCQQAIAGHCKEMGNRMAILDLPVKTPPDRVADLLAGLKTDAAAYTAVYYPALEVPWLSPDARKETKRYAPPCGHVAGVWARVDDERGVHKAPANEVLAEVDGLEYEVSAARQGGLNDKGLNCIRTFPGRGVLVWGARTLAVDTEWQYLSVRRLVCYLEESIRLGSLWAVFEPNDERLWSGLRRNVTAFLTDLWRRGALQGQTPEQAFFVHCNEINNPERDRLAGRVTCDIGVAPVRPAEFVHFKVVQLTAQTGA
ncbi:phage tail sheath family protein [Streptomyces orinoci]|uniref:Phage tail sheath C-terminal domain-containing protein n=1 Tax=Streptomyces orinoci TaxID=67339 RepID=A0ABV3K0N3_STRON|nr:phage tail sheath C-terminal domain-containing protein [Streptomyces orinoci]